ncbi:hypothetical protein ACQP10_38030 (plasmid) [Streptosporangium sandarakinum]|uniref:hypothetical protein n=1 Tax=Streptosporangium sandarakinum TaxID=1260955 RepID=UPI003D8A037F
MSNRVRVKLANPLRTEDAEELGLEPRTYPTGAEIELPRPYALRLAGAGYVEGAEPQNPATVHAALKPVTPPTPASAPAPASAPVVAGASPKKPAKAEQE